MVLEVKTEIMMMKDPEEVDKEEEDAEAVIDIDVAAPEVVPEMNKEERMISIDKMLLRISNLKTLEEVLLNKRETIEILKEENKEEEEMMIITVEDIEVAKEIKDVITIKKTEIEISEAEIVEDTEEDIMIREEMIMITEDLMIEKKEDLEAEIEVMAEDVMTMKTEDMMIEKKEEMTDLVEDSEAVEVAEVASVVDLA